LNGHTHAAQAVKEIEARESGTNHDDVKIFDPTVACAFRFGRIHMVPLLSQDQPAVCRVSTLRTWPVTNEAAPDTMKTIALA
jgi:hypothetical protein